MPEYYIRLNDDNEAQGPMTEGQLKLLADEGKITPQTLHFLDDITGWQPIETNPSLAQQLWQQSKQKLTLKTRSPMPEVKEKVQSKATLKPKADDPKLSVEEMLQASQGRTKATEHITKENRWRNKTAGLSLPLMTIAYLALGGLMLMQNYDQLNEIVLAQNWMGLLNPFLIMTMVTVFIGILLLLSVTAIYPLARYIAVMMMGYLCLDAWNHLYEGIQSGWLLLGTGIGFGIGVFWGSITLSFWQLCLAMLIAYAGVGCYLGFILQG